MNNVEIVAHFIAGIARNNEPAFILDREKAEAEILSDSQAYKGLGIKILSICGGLLGTLFFLGFIAMTVLESSGATFVFGTIVLIVSIVLDKKSENTVLDAICIGAFLSGCVLLGYAIHKMFDSDNLTILLLLAIALITIIATENYMLNLFAVFIFNGCLFAFIETNNANVFTHLLTAFLVIGFVAINLLEAKALTKSRAINTRYAPFRTAFLVSLIALLTYLSINFVRPEVPYRWVSSIVIIAAIVFSISVVIDFLKLKRGQFIIYGFALLILASAIFAPAICGAILILIIATHTNHKLSLILGITALIYFVGQFYYDLQYTLLVKSIFMICTGVLLLIAAYIFNKQLKAHE